MQKSVEGAIYGAIVEELFQPPSGDADIDIRIEFFIFFRFDLQIGQDFKQKKVP